MFCKFSLISPLLTLLFVLMAPPLLQALPDEEIQSMVKADVDFARSEKRILDIWKSLSRENKSALKQEQLEWINTDRDLAAARLIKKGESKIKAYTIVTDQRSDYILAVAYGTTGSNSLSETNGSLSGQSENSQLCSLDELYQITAKIDKIIEKSTEKHRWDLKNENEIINEANQISEQKFTLSTTKGKEKELSLLCRRSEALLDKIK